MSQFKPRFFVFDLDGTALGGRQPYAQFPRPFARLLDELADRGVRWATNTTWPVESQFELLRRSGVKSAPAFLCGLTGLSLGLVKRGELRVCPRHAKMVLARSRRFRRRLWPLIRSIFLKLLRANLVRRFSFDNFETYNLIDFTCEKKDAAAVARHLQPLLAPGLYYPWSPLDQPANMLLPAYMNKGEALRRMLKRLKVRPEEVIAAGNGTNDLPMLDSTLARWLVCPANAHPLVIEAVKRQEGFVGARNFAWGVVDGVKEIILDF